MSRDVIKTLSKEYQNDLSVMVISEASGRCGDHRNRLGRADIYNLVFLENKFLIVLKTTKR